MSTAMETSRMTVETEVVAKARRRRFTAAEKLRVLREADRCSKPGELGALLRREGLYSSPVGVARSATAGGAGGADAAAARPASEARGSPRQKDRRTRGRDAAG